MPNKDEMFIFLGGQDVSSVLYMCVCVRVFVRTCDRGKKSNGKCLNIQRLNVLQHMCMLSLFSICASVCVCVWVCVSEFLCVNVCVSVCVRMCVHTRKRVRRSCTVKARSLETVFNNPATISRSQSEFFRREIRRF